MGTPRAVEFDGLARAPWAAVLSHAQLLRVREALLLRRVGAGETVWRSGNEASHWVGVVDGLLKMSVAGADGRATTMTGAMPGAWFGEGSLFEKQPWRYDVIALRPIRIALLPRETFLWLRECSLPFNHYLQHLLSERLGTFIGMLADDRLLGVDARVVRCLVRLHDQAGHGEVRHVIRLRQDEIGQLAGVSRQRANAALRRLQRDDLVSMQVGGVILLRLDALRGFTEDATGTSDNLDGVKIS